MNIAYCDCFSGISGDMFLAALIDAGLPLEYLQQQLEKLDLPEVITITTKETCQNGFRALQIKSLIEGDCDDDHDHHHEHHHNHHNHRHYSDIVEILEHSSLSQNIIQISQSIFCKLAQAEARVHGSNISDVHFHEVGALDSIVDIVGAAVGLDYFSIDRLYSSSLPFNGGKVKTQHGIIPIPAPATLELMQMAKVSLIPSPIEKELVTPTGAAILAELATFERPSMTVKSIGIGAGSMILPWANIFRLFIGPENPSLITSNLVLMETNIDDMNPQVYGIVQQKAMNAGALDVFMTPTYMKKNRPAVILSIISPRTNEAALARLLLEETSTFGIRVQPIERYEAEREKRAVHTPFGQVDVKLKILDGKIRQVAPEFESCQMLSEKANVAFNEVYFSAMFEGQKKFLKKKEA